jgi:hypothetical protein
VGNIECVGSKYSPECLFDFTHSVKCVDQIVYRCTDNNQFVIEDYFPSGKSKQNKKEENEQKLKLDEFEEIEQTFKLIPVVRLIHLCEVNGFVGKFRELF